MIGSQSGDNKMWRWQTKKAKRDFNERIIQPADRILLLMENEPNVRAAKQAYNSCIDILCSSDLHAFLVFLKEAHVLLHWPHPQEVFS